LSVLDFVNPSYNETTLAFSLAQAQIFSIVAADAAEKRNDRFRGTVPIFAGTVA
jgi:hypothetical protein